MGIITHHISAHKKIHKMTILLFIVSIGFGEVFNFAGFKLSYITSFLLVVTYTFDSGGKVVPVVRNSKYKSLLIYCLIWILYATIQSLWAHDFELWALYYRALLINVFIIFMIVLYIRDMNDWFWINTAFVVLICVSVGVGLWEIVSGGHLINLIGKNNIQYYMNRPYAFYGQGNDFATVLVYGIIAICLNIHFLRKKILWIFFNIIVLIVIIYELIVIDSRGAIYATILLLLLLPLSRWLSRWSRKSKKKFQIFLMIVISVVAIVATYIFINFSIEEIVYEISSWSSVDANYRSDMGRVQITADGLVALMNTAGFGVGPGQSITIGNINLHNFYLEILVEYGIFVGGYLLFVFLRLLTDTSRELAVWPESFIKAFPITMIVLGISASGAVSLRPTWVIATLLYALKYADFQTERR